MMIQCLLRPVLSLSRILVLAVAVLVAAPFTTIEALAVNPDEVLSDPALEKRARHLSAGVRCMVCQNQSIDDSDADLARDLRLLVRERLVKGDTDDEVLDYLVSRYGEFVLLKPRFEARTILLWSFPVLVLLGGIAIIWLSRRKAVSAPSHLVPLTEEEKQHLQNLLDGK
ncbi:cytochrome c-type biogenesis protein [Pseudochrobactrum sp. HB0163]|uniref:cytochrome c-type biogenesis protein n=1 Tax=Pseudochrobactrum sp. HB0163 TaxID=3450708 RepID=UPI003F6E3348